MGSAFIVMATHELTIVSPSTHNLVSLINITINWMIYPRLHPFHGTPVYISISKDRLW
jgi:hypothetical protein